MRAAGILFCTLSARAVSCLRTGSTTGGSTSSWTTFSPKGKAEPMIIAIPNNQIIHRSHPQHTELTFDLFEQELRHHLIPMINREYDTIPQPQGREISGL